MLLAVPPEKWSIYFRKIVHLFLEMRHFFCVRTQKNVRTQKIRLGGVHKKTFKHLFGWNKSLRPPPGMGACRRRIWSSFCIISWDRFFCVRTQKRRPGRLTCIWDSTCWTSWWRGPGSCKIFVFYWFYKGLPPILVSTPGWPPAGRKAVVAPPRHQNCFFVYVHKKDKLRTQKTFGLRTPKNV